MIVVVPMAGKGTRFSEKGYDIPKPLIEVNGKPMFVWALKSIENVERRLIVFIILDEHDKIYNLSATIMKYCNESIVIRKIAQTTNGQLSTVLEASDLIDDNEDVLIMSSDSYVISEIGFHIKKLKSNISGVISVIGMPGENYSFVQVDSFGNVSHVSEKERISELASTGIYYFRKGGDLKYFAKEIVDNKELTKGEYYIIPVYEKMIKSKKNVIISRADEMYDLGTPESLVNFVHKNNPGCL